MTAPTKSVQADKPAASTAQKAVEKAFVVSVHGDMIHLFTNVRFTSDPKKVEIDGFVQAQLDAGKLQIVEA